MIIMNCNRQDISGKLAMTEVSLGQAWLLHAQLGGGDSVAWS